MIRILCFGDSNTWGFDPDHPFQRYGHNVRWTGVLKEQLGESYEVIEEGLNGRTTVWDDPFGEHKNGKTYLAPCLESHRELDLVILMLGTNDLKTYFRLSACDAAQGVKALSLVVKSSGSGRGGGAPELLLVSPPPFKARSFLEHIYAGAEAKSKELRAHLQTVATVLGCHFLDAAEFVTSCSADGVHWEADQHARFATAIRAAVLSIRFYQ